MQELHTYHRQGLFTEGIFQLILADLTVFISRSTCITPAAKSAEEEIPSDVQHQIFMTQRYRDQLNSATVCSSENLPKLRAQEHRLERKEMVCSIFISYK